MLMRSMRRACSVRRSDICAVRRATEAKREALMHEPTTTTKMT